MSFALHHLRHPWRAQLRMGRPVIGGPLVGVWWIVLLRALLAIVCAVLALVWPHLALVPLVRTFGVFALLEGLLCLFVSNLRRQSDTRAWEAVGGIISVAAGAAALTDPQRIALVLVMAAGAWLLMRGAVASCEALLARRTRLQEDEASLRSRRFLTREELCLVIDGVMSGMFGLTMFVVPHLGALGLVLGVGGWALLHGVLMVGYALELRQSAPEAAP
jgi:uncharacterized membrane protein HdeD (DUF308 family)